LLSGPAGAATLWARMTLAANTTARTNHLGVHGITIPVSASGFRFPQPMRPCTNLTIACRTLGWLIVAD